MNTTQHNTHTNIHILTDIPKRTHRDTRIVCLKIKYPNSQT